MTNAAFRIQLISDSESIEALREAAAAQAVATEPAKLPVSDQRFGLAEAAAILAVVASAAQIADLLVKAYVHLRGTRKITVKTPRGSVTIEGNASTSADQVLAKIREAGIL